MADVLALGECMVELAVRPDGTYALAHAGDVFNTAVYLARLGVRTEFGTALGDDEASDRIAALAAAEGVRLAHAARLPGRSPGLYMIDLDARGERRFSYWRGESAARTMLDGAAGEALLAAIPNHPWVYLTGITLSILSTQARARLDAALDRARAGGTRIAFDSNYRARGWPDMATARAVIGGAIARTDVLLAGEDEQAALGLAARARETVVKRGADGCVVDGVLVPAVGARAIDTTAAGDSFNAAYLAARLAGADPVAAARAGARLAAIVVTHRGAITPAGSTPDLASLLAGAGAP